VQVSILRLILDFSLVPIFITNEEKLEFHSLHLKEVIAMEGIYLLLSLHNILLNIMLTLFFFSYILISYKYDFETVLWSPPDSYDTQPSPFLAHILSSYCLMVVLALE